MREVPRIEGEDDVRLPPPRANRDLPDPDGIRVPPSPDAAHVVLRGVEVMPRGDGKAAEQHAGGVHPLAGPARHPDVYVDAHAVSSNGTTNPPREIRPRGGYRPSSGRPSITSRATPIGDVAGVNALTVSYDAVHSSPSVPIACRRFRLATR